MKGFKIALAGLLSFVTAVAQMVQVQLFQPPPNQLRESDLWRVRLTNFSNETLKIYLEGTVDEARDGRIAHARSAVFSLPPGTHTMTATQFSPIEVIRVDQRYRSIFERTGQVPSGEYTVCVTAYEASTGEELGSDCFEQVVERLSPPVLIEPADGDTVQEQRPTFTWLPPTPLPMGQRVTYTLRIVEILGRQTPYDAMLRNPAFLTRRSIPTTLLVYPLTARPFEAGKRYAWQVQAYAGTTLLGESEVWSFVFAPPKPPKQASKPAAAIDVSLFTAGLAHSFAVKTNKPAVTDPIAFRTEYLLPQLATQKVRVDKALIKSIAQAALQRQMPQPSTRRTAVAKPLQQIWQLYLQGALYGWGSNRYRQVGQQNAMIPQPILTSLSSVVAVAAGYWHSLAVLKNGKLYAWGKNDYGQCGNATDAILDQPKVIAHPQQKKFIAVAAGERHSLALDEDRIVWAWGININGELGIGHTSAMESTPVKVASFVKLGPVNGIAAGVAHSLALAGGQVYGWGSNAYAQLGFIPSELPDYRVLKPRRIEGLRNIIAIAAGDYHNLALDKQGFVWAWGRNSNGQVHPDSGAIVARPVRVPGLTDVVDIAAGSCFSVALRRDSTVWVWGSNEVGITETGERWNPVKPQKVPGLTGVVRIAAGGSHILALRADGTLVAWGNNSKGQLGRGSITDILSDPSLPPVPIAPVALP